MKEEDMKKLLCAVLDCGVLDIGIMDDTQYNFYDIVQELKSEDMEISLGAICDIIFCKGQSELYGAVNALLDEKREELNDLNCNEELDAEEERLDKEKEKLEEEIEELERLNPYQDVTWYFNFLDTSCWLDDKEVYEKYLPDEIKRIEENMEFDFMG